MHTQREVVLLIWNLEVRHVLQTVLEVQVAHPAGQLPQVLVPGILYYPAPHVVATAVTLLVVVLVVFVVVFVTFACAREAEVTAAWPSLLLRTPFFSLSNQSENLLWAKTIWGLLNELM